VSQATAGAIALPVGDAAAVSTLAAESSAVGLRLLPRRLRHPNPRLVLPTCLPHEAMPHRPLTASTSAAWMVD